MRAGPAFGRRAAGRGQAAARPAPASPREADALSLQAQAFAAQVAAEKALAGGPDPELAQWKRAHRATMWGAAGTWKYWTAILGLLSFAGHVHDFGPHTDTLALVLRGLASACGVMALWRGLRREAPV